MRRQQSRTHSLQRDRMSNNRYVALPGGRRWIAGNIMGVLVENVLTEQVPGAGSVRLEMDFGNLREILNGAVIDSCTVSASGVGLDALTITSITIENDYTVSALFSGGEAGTYAVVFTPTIEFEDATTQVLPPRTATLILV